MILLLILASIAIASLFGENGVIAKAVRAREEHNLNQYKEEIGLIVAEEITQRQTEEKLEPMIKSLEDKIKQKNWVKENGTSKYDKNMIPIPDEQAQEGKYLIIESKEGYEFILEVDNEKGTAKLITANKEAGKKYKITYDLNGGEGEIPSTQEVRQGFCILLPENTGTKQDYLFVGWSTDKSGNGTNILAGGAYLPQGEEYDITLYAIWSYNAVTITFDGNGATGGSMTSKKVIKGEDSTLTKNQFTKDGYKFIGWTKTKGSTTKEYDDGETINTKEDITLYAIWQQIVPTFTKVANKPDISGFNENTTYYVAWDLTQSPYTINDTISINQIPPSNWYDYTSGKNKWVNVKTTGGGNDCYWVWIPRYAYQVPDRESGGETINVKFLKGTINTPIDGTSIRISNNTTKGSWNIHLAFWWDDNNNGVEDEGEQLTGIWVAKYDASSNTSDATNVASYGASNNGNNSTDKVKIVPNVISWRNITVNNVFKICRNLTTSGNTLEGTSKIDSHMMKNTEWGAIAYLSRSIYGKNGKVWSNPWCYDNHTYCSTITGRANKNNDADAFLNGNSTSNYEAVTDAYNTGNVYGVYDMAGGANEYVAAICKGGISDDSRSELWKDSNAKYVNQYTKTTGSQSTYFGNTDKYGDAVYETSTSGYKVNGKWCGWDNSYSHYPALDRPVFIRGGASSAAQYEGTAHVFAFTYYNGDAIEDVGFRPVITGL